MYGPLWRLLPGSLPVKIVLSLILVAVVVVVCFLWIFPAIAPYMPFNGNSVQSGLPLLPSLPLLASLPAATSNPFVV